MRKKYFTACAGAAMLAASACGGGGAEGATTPGAQYDGPIGSTDTATGEQHYNRYCASCHPGGGAGVGPAIQTLAWTPPKMRQQIREGEGSMPPIPESRLDATGLEALLAYLQQMGSVAAAP